MVVVNKLLKVKCLVKQFAWPIIIIISFLVQNNLLNCVCTVHFKSISDLYYWLNICMVYGLFTFSFCVWIWKLYSQQQSIEKYEFYATTNACLLILSNIYIYFSLLEEWFQDTIGFTWGQILAARQWLQKLYNRLLQV